VGSDDVDVLFLARRLKDAKSRGVGVLKDDIDSARELRERLFLSCAHVIPIADIGCDHRDAGLHRPRSALERAKALDNWRELGSADHAELVRLGYRSREHSREIRWFRESKGESGEIGSGGCSRGCHIDRFRKLGCHTLRRILILESMAKDERVT